MAEVTLIEAGRLAALQEMRRDPTVWVLGEDVARGGLWGQYKGFFEEFGADRAVSTPISESTIMGAGLGAALVGTRPIIEMRIFDFVMCAMDELINQIAKIRYMLVDRQGLPWSYVCRTGCGAIPLRSTPKCLKLGSHICRVSSW